MPGRVQAIRSACTAAMPERALDLGLTLPVSRVIVNQAHCIATGGSFDNGLPFSLSMGCGTWGRNNFSDNMNYRHYMNITRVSRPIEEHVPSEADIFGAYFGQVRTPMSAAATTVQVLVERGARSHGRCALRAGNRQRTRLELCAAGAGLPARERLVAASRRAGGRYGFGGHAQRPEHPARVAGRDVGRALRQPGQPAVAARADALCARRIQTARPSWSAPEWRRARGCDRGRTRAPGGVDRGRSRCAAICRTKTRWPPQSATRRRPAARRWHC